MEIMQQYFWLICGLWCGAGGSLFTWLTLRRQVSADAIDREEIRSFAVRQALWILIPCVALWLLQQSVSGAIGPEFLGWPSPQRIIAKALAVFVWGALLYWIFLKNGAAILSKYSGALSSSPRFLTSPAAFKLMAIVVVLSGVSAMFMDRH